MNHRYLVTGAQGFVGRFVVAEVLRTDPVAHVLGIGRSPQSFSTFTHWLNWCGNDLQAPLPVDLPSDLYSSDRYQYDAVDLLDEPRLSDVVQQFRPTRVIHLASGLWGDKADKLFECNVQGTINLLQVLTNADDGCLDRIVLGSTGGVYGRPNGDSRQLPFSESMPPEPIHMYSVSKLAGEMAAQVIARDANLPICLARIFNIVGPGQDERHVCGRWLSELTAIQMGQKPPVMSVGNLEPTRDMIDVRDVAAALLTICNAGSDSEAYNVASGVETKINAILDLCLQLADQPNIEITALPPRKVELPRHFADITKLSRLGWKPQYELAQSLADLHTYYVESVVPCLLRRVGGTDG